MHNIFIHLGISSCKKAEIKPLGRILRGFMTHTLAQFPVPQQRDCLTQQSNAIMGRNKEAIMSMTDDFRNPTCCKTDNWRAAT